MLVPDKLVPCVPPGMSTAPALPAASGPSWGGRKVATGGGGSPSVPWKGRREELLRVACVNWVGVNEEGERRDIRTSRGIRPGARHFTYPPPPHPTVFPSKLYAAALFILSPLRQDQSTCPSHDLGGRHLGLVVQGCRVQKELCEQDRRSGGIILSESLVTS